MRVFVACEIPEELRRLVGREASRVKAQFPVARWVREDALHLTLLFLGEIEDDSRSRLQERVAGVFSAFSPMSVGIRGAGTFPADRPARVAWLGIECPDQFLELATAVRSGGRAFAARPERRAYRPHLTVARCRPPWPRAATERWETEFAGALGSPFTLRRGVLMRSRLDSRGARYEVVTAFPMSDE